MSTTEFWVCSCKKWKSIAWTFVCFLDGLDACQQSASLGKRAARYATLFVKSIRRLIVVAIYLNSENWRNYQQWDGCKISSDGVPNGSGTLASDRGWINIWNPWSTESDANLDNSTCIQYQICTVRVLLFFPITLFEQYLLACTANIYSF